ncbi:uronyl 2-sulfotransferase-like [Anthonomus grandis grandis]|uniref:uronyl 2-sulfotransferase-like n=1 Tax=Anthonomus grandis grandis TaxID=2921223 RepID=UPI002166032D|nr:uronyl 2-sulfotransferase-like [Anthonomus grandis grandis]
MIRRRRIKICNLFLIWLGLLITGALIYKTSDMSSDFNETVKNKIPKKSLLSVASTINASSTTETNRKPSTTTPVTKRVTKSMSQLGKMDEINKHFLFLNSVPKSGSEILIFLLERIQGGNNFKHVRLKGGNRRRLNDIQQEELIQEIYDIRQDLAVPLSFDRPVYFLDFSKFDKQMPTYVNLIRHPVAKVMSRAFSKKTGTYDSYFVRCLLDVQRNCNFKSGRPYDLTIPYFCGHDERCMFLNNQWALERAKKNVEKYYKVVGVLEELNVTLDALEVELPQFFRGARVVYQQHLLDIYNHKKEPEVPKDVRRSLEESLVMEIEFYEWVKSRLLGNVKANS